MDRYRPRFQRGGHRLVWMSALTFDIGGEVGRGCSPSVPPPCGRKTAPTVSLTVTNFTCRWQAFLSAVGADRNTNHHRQHALHDVPHWQIVAISFGAFTILLIWLNLACQSNLSVCRCRRCPSNGFALPANQRHHLGRIATVGVYLATRGTPAG